MEPANILRTKRQLYVMKQLNQKFATENAIITQADEGKTIVIINSEEYSNKVHTFPTTNNFRTLPIDIRNLHITQRNNET